MKKLLAILLSAAMVLSLAACGGGGGTGESSVSAGTPESTGSTASKPESGTEAPETGDTDFSGQKMEIAVNYSGPQAAAFNKLVDKFKGETGCEVDVSEYGTDYESNMKTRMASNELPDLFMTHGWSILRYKEYLMPLNDQPWISDLDESALGVIQDDDDSIYVLMTSELVNGTLVDLDTCEAAGVDPYSLKTWADFTDACAKLKEAGYTPIGAISNPGLLANVAGTWVSYAGEQAEDSEKMLDGTWDWKSYRPFLEQIAQWADAGYFYDDILTMKDTDLSERFSSGKAGFNYGNDPVFLVNCLELNPDKKFAFIPTLASKEGGKMHIGIGEGNAFGVNKDTKNEALSKAFLNFLAKPENAVELNQATGTITCLKSAMALDDSYAQQVFNEMQEKYKDADVFYENLWDRKYMPSGMWPIFGNACAMLLEDHSESGIDACLQYLLENYQDLYDAAQAG